MPFERKINQNQTQFFPFKTKSETIKKKIIKLIHKIKKKKKMKEIKAIATEYVSECGLINACI